MAYANGNEVLFSGEYHEGDNVNLNVDVVQTTGNSETLVMSQRAVTEGLNDIKSGNVNDRSLGAEKQSWLEPNGTTTYEETTSLYSGLVNGLVSLDGTPNTSAAYLRTDYIDITPFDRVQVKVRSFTPHTETTERAFWIARYDKDKNFIEGSRENFKMYSLTDSGEIDTEREVPNSVSCPVQNLQQINTVSFYQYGMGKEISAADYDDGTVYIILFNLQVGDTVVMSIEGVTQTTVVSGYVVPKSMIPTSVLNDIEDLKENKNQEQDFTITDGSITTEKLADGAVTKEKTAWLEPNGTTTYEETTSLYSGLVNGLVSLDGTPNTSAAYLRTDYIDITPFDRVQVKVRSFTPHTETTERAFWIARYDKDKNFIEGSRENFKMYSLTDSGEIDTEREVPNSVSCPVQNLQQINTVSFYQYGMGKEISAADYDDGTVYIILFNLQVGDTVVMSIEGVTQTTVVSGYVVPKSMIPTSVLNDIEDLKENKNQEQDFTITDGSITTEKLADGAVTEEKLSADVAEKLNATNKGAEDGITLSDYAEPLIDNIALAAKAHMKEDSLCIVLFADTHYEAEDTCFPTLIAKKLAQATNASAILHLGDLVHLYTEGKAVGLELFQRHSKILQGTKIPYLQVVGNHDDGQMYLHTYSKDYSAENYIKAYEMYHATTKQSRNHITLGSKNGWYYMDDEDSKTRLIVLNSHEYPWVVNDDGTLAYDSNAAESISCIYSTEQIEWLANTALNFADKGDVTEQAKWSVLAFAHMGTSNWTAINSVFTAFWAGTKKERFSSDQIDTYGLYDYSGITITNDFSLVGGRKIAFLCGDIHEDKVSGGNYPLVTFLDCKLQATNLGTPNEAALSVLVVTPSEGKITELRFGEGTKTVDDVEVAHDPLTDYDNYRVIDF